jgi:hypothetical protein
MSQPTNTEVPYSAERAGPVTNAAGEPRVRDTQPPSPASEAEHFARTAAEQASEVVEQTRRQARDVVEEARGQVRDQADAARRKVAEGLRALSDELTVMVQRSKQTGLATDLVRQLGERGEDAAQWLEDRTPGQMLDDVRGLARRHPGSFLLGAVASGVLAGRLTRALTSSESSSLPRPSQPTDPPPPPNSVSGETAAATAPATVGDYVEELERQQGTPLTGPYSPSPTPRRR